jgi:hypothetical protein
MTTTNNYTTQGTTLTHTGGSNIAIGTLASGTSNTFTGTPFFTPPAAITLTDNPITYDSKHSDGNTYQHEVAVIQITRNDSGEVIKSKVVKTFWVETRNQGSVDYAASKNPAVSEFEPNDIIIKTLRTIIL